MNLFALPHTGLDRAALLEIVADFAAPIDPMVFVGFGSPLQRFILEGTARDGDVAMHCRLEKLKGAGPGLHAIRA